MCVFSPWQSARREETHEQTWCSLDEETSVLPQALARFPLDPSSRTLPSHTPLAHFPGPEDSSHPLCSSLPSDAVGDVGGCVSIHSTAHFTQGTHRPEASAAEQQDTTETEQQSSAPPLQHLVADECKRSSPWQQTERTGLGGEGGRGGAAGPSGSFRNYGKSRDFKWEVKPYVRTSGSHNNEDASSEFAYGQAGKVDGRPGSGPRVSALEEECPVRVESSYLSAAECKVPAVSRMESGCDVGRGVGVGPGSIGSGLVTHTSAGRSGERSESGFTGAGMEFCSMCLMPFAKGFSQMECDSHLAQCLSDMNTDMVW
ncbi:uncharacterized protein LOC143511709 [Brachyhypopomus gauderio]|uniref:uncharacterized protein LOC143511709 n=1 Tax=Brachyhypopomus gauderio TaxID=698409 RepID=UPI004041CAB4